MPFKFSIFTVLTLLISSVMFAQEQSIRDYNTVSDSLFRKYRKKNPMLIRSKSHTASVSFFFYKSWNRWHGIYFKDVALLMPNGQFMHQIQITPFKSDTIGRKLICLGIDTLKQYSYNELTTYYNKKLEESGSTNIEYGLPRCTSGGAITIIIKGDHYSYSDCLYENKILNELPEIGRFVAIYVYLETKIHPKIIKM